MRRKAVLFFILPLILWLSYFLPGEDSCSTFMLKHGSEQIFGHNLDMPMSIEGIVDIIKEI